MMPIHKMQFLEVKASHGDLAIKALLDFHAVRMITKYDLEVSKCAKFPIKEDVKERIKRQLWHDTYGEVLRPLNEFRHHILKYLPYERLREAEEAFAKVDKLLEYPSTPQTAKEGE